MSDSIPTYRCEGCGTMRHIYGADFGQPCPICARIRYCLECANEMEASDEGAICKTCDMRQLNGDQSEMGMSPDQFEREQP